MGDGECFAVHIGVVVQYGNRDGGVFRRSATIVNGYWRIVHTGDGDRQRGGVGGQIAWVFDGVSEYIDLTLASVKPLRSGIGRVGVRTIGAQSQRTPCARQGGAYGACCGTKSHGGDCQAVAIRICVGACAQDHAIGGGDIKRCVLIGATGVKYGQGRIVDAAHIQGDGGRRRRSAGLAVRDGVREVSRAVIAGSWIKSDSAIGVDGDSAIRNGHRRADSDRIAVDLCDGQWVAIGIGVVSQHRNCDGRVFQDGQCVWVCHWYVIDRGDIHMHIALHGRIAVGDGVGEVHWAVEVGRRCKTELAIGGE